VRIPKHIGNLQTETEEPIHADVRGPNANKRKQSSAVSSDGGNGYRQRQHITMDEVVGDSANSRADRVAQHRQIGHQQ
jgi:hypothetical protein